MARKSIFVSDLSGEEIPEGKGAKIRITFADARKGSAELDVTDEEAEELARKAERPDDAVGGPRPKRSPGRRKPAGRIAPSSRGTSGAPLSVARRGNAVRRVDSVGVSSLQIVRIQGN